MVQITEKVIWTVCPQGLAPNGDRLINIHVAPRLSAAPANSGLVSDIASWADWPAELAKCKLQLVAYSGTAQTPITATVMSKAQSDVWAALMLKTTRIVDHVFTDLRNALILSYPVADLQKLMLDLYVKLGMGAGDGLPTSEDIMRIGWPGVMPYEKPRPPKGNRNGGYKQKPPQPINLSGRINALRKAGAQTAATSTPDGLLKHFELFHTPLLAPEVHQYVRKENDPRENAYWHGHSHPKLPSEAELANETDFHKIVAAIGNYAELAPLCGLVIKLVVPKSALPDGQYRLGLAPIRTGNKDIRPITACEVGPADFTARAKNPGLVGNRFLDLKAQKLELIQLDVDGAAHKAIGIAASLPRMEVTQFNDTGTIEGDALPETGAPSLRTGGLMLAQTGRHQTVKTRADRAGAQNDKIAGIMDDLYAEDLLRGYRIDVADLSRGGQWKSLCLRTIDYTFTYGKTLAKDTLDKRKWKLDANGRARGTSPAEEGVIGTALTSSADGSIKDAYKVHEGLFAWRGWSLCAPEPFRSLVHEAGAAGDVCETDAKITGGTDGEAEAHRAMIGCTEGKVPDKMPLGTDFNVARDPLTKQGSLPVLRFGHSYKVRVRTVDITGGSAPHTSGVAGDAASDAVPYLRFEPVEAPVITLVSTLPAQPINSDKVEMRTVVPWTSVELPLQGESMTRMALRTYDSDWPGGNDTVTRRNAAPPRVTQRFAETHGVVDDVLGKPSPAMFRILATQDRGFDYAQVPPADLLNPLSDAASHGEPTRYAVAAEKFALPYLPDPMAYKVMAQLKTLGSSNWKTTNTITLYDGIERLVPFGWPNAKPLLIEGREDIQAFTFDEASRTLLVPMPKACRHILRLSCVMDDYGIQQMALWRQMMDSATTPELKKRLDAQLGRIKRGRHWLFTPWREIELVHATQRPTIVPQVTNIDAKREPGALRLDIKSLTTIVSSPSTGRLDLRAVWREPEDNAVEIDAKSAPVVRTHKAVVHQANVLREAAPSDQLTLTNIAHNFADTRYRRVLYSMDAVSRFREFFEADIRNDPRLMTVSSDKTLTAWVRNSAPPPAPEVLYVIPAFGWLTHKDKAATKRTGAIRVYLDRPWMVSGFNEMLAVVLPNPDDADNIGVTALNQSILTQWGRDPLTLTPNIATSSPKASDFKRALRNGPIDTPNAGFDPAEGLDIPKPSMSDRSAGDFKLRNLKIPGQDPNRRFAVAPHETGFDPERQLWYADIALTLPKGSYYPFLRLAVARYQPFSAEGCHVSPVVSCDFMQLSPDRIAVLLPLPATPGRFKVFVYGDEGKLRDGLKGLAPFTQVDVQVQVRDAQSDDDLGWRNASTTGRRRSRNGRLEVPTQIPPQLPTGPRPNVNPETQADRMAIDIARDLDQGPSTSTKGVVLPEQRLKGGGKEVFNPALPQGEISVPNTLPPTIPLTDAPNLIFDEVFDAPAAPTGGQRRLLITETEIYTDSTGKPAERLVYAETIVF